MPLPLLLLPLDAAGAGDGLGSLFDSLFVSGEAGPAAAALEPVSEDPPPFASEFLELALDEE